MWDAGSGGHWSIPTPPALVGWWEWAAVTRSGLLDAPGRPPGLTVQLSLRLFVVPRRRRR